jgi:tRNA modification GTPase
LQTALKELAGFRSSGEGVFIARRRHLDALDHAEHALNEAVRLAAQGTGGEFIAEELRQAQRYLGEITGTFSSDDLLGRIFASFCIGK